ncbi:MAG: GntR family transcriptional regulator [Firmicutes bacterium]|nr:GntR family transcriptional regulator [Bacillota bacterium]
MVPRVQFAFDDLVAAVYKKIKEMILNQDLKPGTKIKQEELERALGVSRTPIIKALHLLIADNLVTYTPRRGFTVKELTTREMVEIFYIRELLDGAAAREAAVKATEEDRAELSA